MAVKARGMPIINVSLQDGVLMAATLLVFDCMVEWTSWKFYFKSSWANILVQYSLLVEFNEGFKHRSTSSDIICNVFTEHD